MQNITIKNTSQTGVTKINYNGYTILAWEDCYEELNELNELWENCKDKNCFVTHPCGLLTDLQDLTELSTKTIDEILTEVKQMIDNGVLQKCSVNTVNRGELKNPFINQI